MAGQLWLLRHGEAEPKGERADELRALTSRGQRQAQAAGMALAVIGARIDAVFTSPRVRALETARLACVAYDGVAEPRIDDAISAGFAAAEALRLRDACPPGAHLLLVGHEPDFSSVIAELTGARVRLKKGGLAMVQLDAASVRGELALLARPGELALIAGMAVAEV